MTAPIQATPPPASAPESRPSAVARAARPPYERAAGRSDPLRIGRTPIHCFAFSVMFFATGVPAAPFVTGTIVEYFYQPGVLALVHIFTLGWISTTIMGVMYRYVPALTRHPVPHPRLALWQVGLFVFGTSGMVAHFQNGVWFGLWLAAALVVATLVMFAANMLPCLYGQLGRGVAETGMFLSVCLFIVAGALGFLLGLDKTYNFLSGDVLTNLAGHVHFAALGWVTLTICAVSYRMVPAFLLPKVQLPRAAIWQLWTLAAAVVALGVVLLAGLDGVTALSVVVALSLIAYLVTMGRLVRSRRMPLDFTMRHALAGIVWLASAIVLGVTLSAIGAQGAAGNRVAAAYGTLGLLGWISNFIIGMSYQLFPGFVSRARSNLGWPAATIAELSIKPPRWLVFIAYNTGVAATAAGFLLGSAATAEAGAAAIAVAGLIYSAVTLWTLSYAYRRSLPKSARTGLRILPE